MDWKEPLFDFIRACDFTKKPLVGCCFGHQAIAVALGGTVEQVGWNVGIETAQFDQGDLPLYVFHQDQVTKLPPDVMRISRSEACPNAGFAKGTHIFTTQAHPEFTPRFMGALVDKYGPMLGKGLAKTQASLHQTAQDQTFAAWASNIFTRGRP